MATPKKTKPNSAKFLAQALLTDSEGNRARVIGIDTTAKGLLRIYVGNSQTKADKIAVRHTIRTTEVRIEDVPTAPKPKPKAP